MSTDTTEEESENVEMTDTVESVPVVSDMTSSKLPYDAAVVFDESVRSCAISLRSFLYMLSRLANNCTVALRRLRSTGPQVPLASNQRSIVLLLALIVDDILDAVPRVPLPCGSMPPLDSLASPLTTTVRRSTGTESDEEVPAEDIPTHALGLDLIQTCRYIAESMDMAYRVHVDDRDRGSLLALSLDAFYKIGGIAKILNAVHYAFAAYIALRSRVAADSLGCSAYDCLPSLDEELLTPQWVLWVRRMYEVEVVPLSNEEARRAVTVVSKSVHCCISYCEKITSWKRFFNAAISGFLQKTCPCTLR
eukprot:Lankesteria_metandrocarpae@DN10663_c0_g1_i1.p1